MQKKIQKYAQNKTQQNAPNSTKLKYTVVCVIDQVGREGVGKGGRGAGLSSY